MEKLGYLDDTMKNNMSRMAALMPESTYYIDGYGGSLKRRVPIMNT